MNYLNFSFHFYTVQIDVILNYSFDTINSIYLIFFINVLPFKGKRFDISLKCFDPTELTMLEISIFPYNLSLFYTSSKNKLEKNRNSFLI